MNAQPWLSVSEAGRLLYSRRPLPGPRALLFVVLTIAAGYALVYFLAQERGDPVFALTGAVGVFIIYVLMFGTGMLEKHRIYERRVVLGTTLPGSTPYVIPLDTIDPASVQLHYRANFIAKGDISRTRRMAVFSTEAVGFSGLHPVIANDKQRRKSPTLAHTSTPMYENEPSAPTPTKTWVVGVGKPEQFLRTLEKPSWQVAATTQQASPTESWQAPSANSLPGSEAKRRRSGQPPSVSCTGWPLNHTSLGRPGLYVLAVATEAVHRTTHCLNNVPSGTAYVPLR